VGEPGLAIYSATKHGIIGLTRSSAIEYGTSNIRINAICPGITRTAMARNVAEDRIRARVPMGRLGDPAEIADAVVWLCSDAASFVTGHTLSVDGGLVIQ
jgi:NAD(P)-dependent dehydrogenase (short-subunit alcohol dehydrogenase family)